MVGLPDPAQIQRDLTTSLEAADRDLTKRPSLVCSNPLLLDTASWGEPQLWHLRSQTGPAGSINYLVDAMLECPGTRSMYTRRLRSLVDYWHDARNDSTSRISRLVRNTYARIGADARYDSQVWNEGDIDAAVDLLIRGQLSARKVQLTQVYGPGGPIPLIPDQQPEAATVT